MKAETTVYVAAEDGNDALTGALGASWRLTWEEAEDECTEGMRPFRVTLTAEDCEEDGK